MNLFKMFKRTRPFLEVLKEYFNKQSIGLKPSTIEKHGYYHVNISDFLRYKRMTDIMLHEVKPVLMEELRVWLYETRPSCSKDHASRHIKHCKAMFKHAVKLQYYSHNPIESVEIERDKIKEAVSLTADEVRKLMHSDFQNLTLEFVTDLFLFQCFTGLSYMDLWKYEITTEAGMEWVTSQTGRGKNGNKYWSEFNDHAKTIHKKYGGRFPEITNQAYNRQIKVIAVKLNINKDLSTHDARKTFATLKYKQGHSLESISDQLGNNPETTRKHYITRGPKRIMNEITRLTDSPFLPQAG